MAVLIIILVLAFIGILISAFMAGGSEKRKTAECWSVAGIGVSALAGAALFFCKGAIKEILLKLTGLCRRYGKNHNDLKYHQMFNSGTECPGIQIINAFSSIKNNVKENLN